MGLLRFLFRLFVSAPASRRPPRFVAVPGPPGDPYARRSAPPHDVAPPPARRAFPSLIVVAGRCHVVDGDTIVIDNRMIRLAGIDAPELDQPYGQNAKWTLIRLCKGQIVEARIEGGDPYDRTVATCRLPDGRDLSAEMVRCGMALDWPKFSGGRYRALEPPGIRKKLWRVDARQKGRFPPSSRI